MDKSFKISNRKKRGKGNLSSFKEDSTDQNQYSKTERKIIKFIEVSKEPETKYLSVDRLRNVKELPKENERLFILTTKNINSVEILPLINSLYGIEKINASFVVINPAGIKELQNYNIGTVIGRDKIEDKILQLKPTNVIFRFSHVKFFNIYTKRGGNINIFCSANPSISSRIENYIIDRTKETFKFYENIINNG